ncbi:hypothetical protein P152DRAFT_130256 [Eremomyces bilateralis CBS 781.70]|uniref:Uncharacterized protein n=1 Tax=Eremomyces bilateralis CBS 781.70 TaxID=1392243 RepID=A0A6G1GFJ3_9PEZI|nr:uncharacterized protein P152DRAFT_130256 [Eremomyces bilateralis CBS 781.70]KAF1816620.1 hypothetical protein P152DRAFT_130256 [Eremomyces bilateralis CBS 781.70]
MKSSAYSASQRAFLFLFPFLSKSSSFCYVWSRVEYILDRLNPAIGPFVFFIYGEQIHARLLPRVSVLHMDPATSPTTPPRRLSCPRDDRLRMPECGFRRSDDGDRRHDHGTVCLRDRSVLRPRGRLLRTSVLLRSVVDLMQRAVVARHVSCPASSQGGSEPCRVRVETVLLGREDPGAHGEGVFVLGEGNKVRERILVDVGEVVLWRLMRVSETLSGEQRGPGKRAAVLPIVMHLERCG